MSLLDSNSAPSSLVQVVQDGTLERVFKDAAYPVLLYRMDAKPELWQENLGQTSIQTRAGLIPVTVSPLSPGNDPSVATYATEQWSVTAAQYGKTINTNMASSYVALASLFSRNVQQLGLNAGQTLNRLSRNKLFGAYLQGDTVGIGASASGQADITVSNIAGFTEVLVDGQLVPVSGSNPLAITFEGAEPTRNVIAAVPDTPGATSGPGTLTVSANLTVGVADREGVYAATRSRVLRAGGGPTVDDIGASDLITPALIRSAVARLRSLNIPTHADGLYHCHLSPSAESALYETTEFQRLFTSMPGSSVYERLQLGDLYGVRFFRNSEAPSQTTVSSTNTQGAGSALFAPELGSDVVNTSGQSVERTIITGGACLYEKYLDESRFISAAGVTGKIGNFTITNQGAAVVTDRIRLTMRSPLDALQQVVTSSWSWSGDFGVPSDSLTGDAARFKRAVVIEHAGGL